LKIILWWKLGVFYLFAWFIIWFFISIKHKICTENSLANRSN
jgi:predicted MPP superfamily phosphohydrolase